MSEESEKENIVTSRNETLFNFILCFVSIVIALGALVWVSAYKREKAEQEQYIRMYIEISQGKEVIIPKDLHYLKMIDRLDGEGLSAERADVARTAVLTAKIPEPVEEKVEK